MLDDVGVDAAISFAFSLFLESIAWVAHTRDLSVRKVRGTLTVRRIQQSDDAQACSTTFTILVTFEL